MSVQTDRDNRLLVYGGFALSLAIAVGLCRPWNLTDHFNIGAPFGRDFVNYWMGGRLALEGRLDVLADLRAYNVLIVERFGHSAEDFFIFSYPPNLLPFLVPFGALPYLPALIAWTAINLALLAWSVRLLTADRRPLVAACLSPAAVTMVLYGHFGGALAVLAVLALTRGARQPALAGLCLALMTVKPQLAAAVGLLMLLIGQWRAVAWSAAGASGLAGLSVLLFGLTPWRDFLHVTVPFQIWLIHEFIPDHLRSTLSLYAAARLAGLSFIAAQVVQTAFALAAIAGAVLLTWRDGLNPRTLTLLLLAGITGLAYFQNYDLAIVVPALSVALFAGDRDEGTERRPLLPFVPACLLWAAPALSIASGFYHSPVINLVVAGVLAIGLVTRARRERSDIGRVAIEVGTSQSVDAPSRSSATTAGARSMQGSSA